VSIWLVGVCSTHILHRDTGSVRIWVRAGSKVGALNGLVGVGSLLGCDALVIAVARVWGAAGAAADAEYPEEACGEGEEDGEPGCDVHVAAHGSVDVVWLQGGVECADESAVECGYGNGSSDDEE
jgi:hypothetical protein